MTNQNKRAQKAFKRSHNQLFESSEYKAEFYNYNSGSYDPDKGEITNESRDTIGSAQVEIVPPTIDSTVSVDGTSFSWDTSIRFPETVEEPSGWGTNWGDNWGGTTLVGAFKPLGEDNERPTEVEVTDPKESDTTTYELHGYKIERGSGMVMCRLVEQ